MLSTFWTTGARTRMRTLAHPFVDFARTTRKDKMSRDQASTYHVTASALGLEPRPLLRQASAFIILTSQIHLIMFGHWLTISSLYKGVSNYHSVGNFPAWFVTCRTWFTPSSSHRVTWWVFVRKSSGDPELAGRQAFDALIRPKCREILTK